MAVQVLFSSPPFIAVEFSLHAYLKVFKLRINFRGNWFKLVGVFNLKWVIV